MSEGLLARARRVVEAGVGSVVETAERLTGTGSMRQAIRDIDGAAEQVRRQQAATKSRLAQAVARRRRLTEQAARAGENARFALTMARDDLAGSALAEKQRAEAEAVVAAAEVAQAEADSDRLAAAFADLTARRKVLADELLAHEAVERSAGQPLPSKVDRRVARAEESFARAQGIVGGGTLVAPTTVLDEMRRDKAVADELAAMKTGPGAPTAAQRRGRKV